MTARDKAREVLAKHLSDNWKFEIRASDLLSALDEAGIALVEKSAVEEWDYEIVVDAEEGEFDWLPVTGDLGGLCAPTREDATAHVHADPLATGRIRAMYVGDSETVEVGE